jgi:hypothetical protein
MKKKFYKTVIKIEVLSEDPIPSNVSLGGIMERADYDDYVAGQETRNQTELTSEEVVDELYKFGSTPLFFGLDDDGNET